MSGIADLTEADRERINKFLSSPIDFPQEFKTWLTDWIGQNLPPIPVDQLQGYIKTRGMQDTFVGSSSITSTSYTDLGGPSLAGIPDGEYLAIFGHLGQMGSSGGGQTNMNLGINGSVPTNESGACWVLLGADATSGCIRARRLLLTAGSGGNTVKAYYRRTNVGGSPTFTNVLERFLVLARTK